MKVQKYLKKLGRYIKSPSFRFQINAHFGMYNGMPDQVYLKKLFKATMGKELDLDDPKTFNEKIQWLKLYDRKPIYTTMVDKYEVKKYVADRIGQEYIIPTLGVWDRFEDIDFDSLPDQFVLKCTHDSGGLVICREKSQLDIYAARKKINNSLKRNYYLDSREWPYKAVKPRIIAEVYMEDENGTQGLTDYKFFCFNGTPRMLYVSQGLECHATASISFYDMEGKEMPFRRRDYRPMERPLVLPKNYSEMKQIAETLAQQVDCPFVRIDLYSIKGALYFSEVTFSPCAGFLPFEPEQWDYTLGSWIVLPSK